MNEWDVINHMGRLPDRIILKGGGMKSKSWKCSKCLIIHDSEEEIRPPSPCACGSIFFEKITQGRESIPKEDTKDGD